MPELINNPIREAVETVERDRAAQVEGAREGRPSLFTCPDCGGTLWQVDEPELLQFRCHVGHIVSGEALLRGQSEAAENSLWYTIRTLNDKMVLARELAAYARDRGEEADAHRFEEQARAAEERGQTLRQIAEGG